MRNVSPAEQFEQTNRDLGGSDSPGITPVRNAFTSWSASIAIDRSLRCGGRTVLANRAIAR